MIKYEISVYDKKKDTETRTVSYGRLETVVECELDQNKIWKSLKGKFFLLAYITPCSTDGQDAVLEPTLYNSMTTEIIVDLRSVQCVVGRIKTREQWGIIDRSEGFARTEFIDGE